MYILHPQTSFDRWNTCGTHSRGGTLDLVLTSCFIASPFQFSSVPALLSDHVALQFFYFLPDVSTIPVSRPNITVPPKHILTYISHMTYLFSTFDYTSPAQFYSRLVSATHAFAGLTYQAHICSISLQITHRIWLHELKRREKMQIELVYCSMGTLSLSSFIANSNPKTF